MTIRTVGTRLSDVTISNCSLSSTGVNLQKVFSCLKQSLDVFYSFRVSTILLSLLATLAICKLIM